MESSDRGHIIRLSNLRGMLDGSIISLLHSHNRINPDVMDSLMAKAYYDGGWADYCSFEDFVAQTSNFYDDGHGMDDEHLDYDDDIMDDNDCFLYPPGVIKPKNKNGGGGNKKSSVIWYYPDYHAEDDRLEFDTLQSFTDFCKDESIQVPLTFYTEYGKCKHGMHCTLDPFMRSVGRRTISYGLSYGEMFYEVCDAEELE